MRIINNQLILKMQVRQFEKATTLSKTLPAHDLKIMVANIIFGLGGGSDFSSACLIAAVETDCEKARDNIIILTAFAPIVIDAVIDLSQSICKYTGMSYFATTADKLTTSKAYKGFTERICDNGWPVIIDNRRNNA